MGLLKLDAHPAVVQRVNHPVKRRGFIANFYLRFYSITGAGNADKVDLSGYQTAGVQVGFFANHNTIGLSVDVHHIHGFAKAGTDAAPLTNGKKGVPFMRSHCLPGGVYQGAASYFFFQPVHHGFQKAVIIVIGYKTDFHAFAFMGRAQVVLLRDLPHLRFSQLAQRKQGAGQTLLLDTPQGVRLIFVGVFSAEQFIAPAALIVTHLCIVTGGDVIGAQLPGFFDQRIPFDFGVTQYTGIGRTSGQIFFHKIIHHLVMKFFAEIKHVMGHIQFGANHTGVGYGVQRAAAAFVVQVATHQLIIP